MDGYPEQQHTSILGELWEKKWRFIALFLLVFLFSLSFLIALGLVPESIAASRLDRASTLAQASSQESVGIAVVGEQETVHPERIVIDAIDTDVAIINPKSRDIAVLDDALREGVVRFPDSGNLNDEANMFLFGHSSFLPIVHNENYRAFNNLDKLKRGDLIRVYGGGEEYIYTVTSVRVDDAAAISVPLGGDERKLTLSTCDSFGEEDDRFVVEADFVGSYPIST